VCIRIIWTAPNQRMDVDAIRRMVCVYEKVDCTK
jgi:hypothetical protein